MIRYRLDSEVEKEAERVDGEGYIYQRKREKTEILSIEHTRRRHKRGNVVQMSKSPNVNSTFPLLHVMRIVR